MFRADSHRKQPGLLHCQGGAGLATGRLQSQEARPYSRAMVCVGRKAQVLARRGMDIWGENHPSRRRAFSPVLTRVAYTSPSPGRRSVWDVLIPTAVPGCPRGRLFT